MLAQSPTDDDGQWRVEQGRLECGAEHGGQCKVHLIVPRLVDGGDVLGKLLDEGHENEAHERVRHVGVLDDVLDLQHQVDGDDSNKGDTHSQGDDALGHSELCLGHVLGLVAVTVLVGLEDGVVDTVVGACLEEHVDKVGQNHENGDDTRNLQRSLVVLLLAELTRVHAVFENGRDSQDDATIDWC